MKWLGKAAVLWALNEAPGVPPHLVAPLVAIAMRAGEDGCAAYPAASTVALQTRKSESQTKRDIAELEELGLICRGDQRRALHIRADRRPVVYDLAMSRGSAHDTPSGNHGVAPMHSRGSAHARHGVAPMPPEEFLKNSRSRGRANGAGAPTAPLPKTRYAAPGCPVCGKAFSQEWLADPETRAQALAGDICHEECVEEDNRRYELAHPDEAGQ